MCRVPTLAYSRMFIFQDPGYEEEVKLTLEIKFLQEHAVEIEKDQIVSSELYGLETGTSRLISSRKVITTFPYSASRIWCNLR